MAIITSNEGFPHFLQQLVDIDAHVVANTARSQGLMPEMGHTAWTVVFKDKADVYYGDVYGFLEYFTTQIKTREYDEAATDKAMVFMRSTDLMVSLDIPTFTQPLPPFIEFTEGDTLLLETDVDGATEYKWFKEDVLLAGETTQSYSKANCVAADSGHYTIEAINANGKSTSTTTVTVNVAKKKATKADA